ncbi:uncharacterized protein LOC134459223 [Engraulis encrasicolus]|uniref:uncharacterized protein LOC134459223 n=1 Tax=Engraulis encrasicolus TaxID=184585 RepID=UPI002FD2BCFC
MDRDILFEALSALVGAPVRPRSSAPTHVLQSYVLNSPHPDVLSITDVLSAVWFENDFWQDVNERRTGVRCLAACRNDLFVMDDDFFDPRFDYDFRHMKDSETYRRGDEVYKRPYGWQRFALNVLDKYPDGNAWLGTPGYRTCSAPGEWPVSYHGTSKAGAEGIIEDCYIPGPGAAYGRGIYSTPDVEITVKHGYAKKFTCKTDGKTYWVCTTSQL